eukprot:g32110.t1
MWVVRSGATAILWISCVIGCSRQEPVGNDRCIQITSGVMYWITLLAKHVWPQLRSVFQLSGPLSTPLRNCVPLWKRTWTCLVNVLPSVNHRSVACGLTGGLYHGEEMGGCLLGWFEEVEFCTSVDAGALRVSPTVPLLLTEPWWSSPQYGATSSDGATLFLPTCSRALLAAPLSRTNLVASDITRKSGVLDKGVSILPKFLMLAPVPLTGLVFGGGARVCPVPRSSHPDRPLLLRRSGPSTVAHRVLGTVEVSSDANSLYELQKGTSIPVSRKPVNHTRLRSFSPSTAVVSGTICLTSPLETDLPWYKYVSSKAACLNVLQYSSVCRKQSSCRSVKFVRNHIVNALDITMDIQLLQINIARNLSDTVIHLPSQRTSNKAQG